MDGRGPQRGGEGGEAVEQEGAEILMRPQSEWTPRRDSHVKWTDEQTGCCLHWLDMSRVKSWKFYSKVVS